MGYALFANRKLVLDSQLNSLQLQQAQRANEQYLLATDNLSMQQELSSMQASQANELQPLYKSLSKTDNETDRSKIQDEINTKEKSFKQEEDAINQKIYLTAVKENAIEMEVKHLETEVSVVQKQLEQVEAAESGGIDRATPKFKGLG